MVNHSNILILALKFPPYPFVGGFRWAHLSNELAKQGHQVTVLTARWRPTVLGTSAPVKVSPNIKIFKINTFFPVNLKYSSRIIIKRIYQLFWYIIGKRLWWDDELQRDGHRIKKKAIAVIKERNCQVVIATGHPFEANYIATAVKSAVPSITLIQDFRDPWVDNPFWYGSPIQHTVRKRRQRIAIQGADLCVCVTNGLMSLMSRQRTIGNWEVVPNGYVPLPVTPVQSGKKETTKASKLVFIYIGNVGNGRIAPFTTFIEAARPFANQLKIIYVGAHAKAIEHTVARLGVAHYVEFFGSMTQHCVLRMVQQSDWALQVNAKKFPYLVSTKIYEYGMLKVPTLSINYGGEVETLIQSAGLGISVNLERDDLHIILSEIIDGVRNRIYSFNVEEYSYRNIAQKYSDLIDRTCFRHLKKENHIEQR